MSTARVINQIPILCEDRDRSLVILTVSCVDFNAYKALPGAVSYENQSFGKTGWNSDRGVAYYRNDAKLVSPIG